MAKKGLHKKEVTDKNGKKRTVWVRPKGNIGIKRKDMPQIDDIDDFEVYAKKNGITLNTRTKRTNKLKFVQKEINQDKVDKIIDDKKAIDKPILVTIDNYVVDGSHRLAARIQDKKKYINTIMADAELKDFLPIAKKYKKVKYKSL